MPGKKIRSDPRTPPGRPGARAGTMGRPRRGTDQQQEAGGEGRPVAGLSMAKRARRRAPPTPKVHVIGQEEKIQLRGGSGIHEGRAHTTHFIGDPPKVGRRAKFDDATKKRMQDALEKFSLDYKAKIGRWPDQKATVPDFVDRLAAEENVSASYSVLRKRVVHPVFRKLKQR
jgi:hypothetical protein